MTLQRMTRWSPKVSFDNDFTNYSLGWLNGNNKVPPAYPKFKRKGMKEPLWIDGWYNPAWVDEELERARRELSRQGEKVIHDKPLLCNAFVTLLRACAKSKDLYTGISVHDDVLKRGLLEMCSDALVTMYAKCGSLASAKKLLDMHKSRSVFLWNALIAAYAQKGHDSDALHCLEWMQCECISPNAVTFTCILKTCGNMRAADRGEQAHNEIARKQLLRNDIVLGNALLDMYAKCGVLGKAQGVLEELPVRDVISWSALIAGYDQHGQPEQALSCFERMQGESFSPDAVNFLCILKACGTIQAADKGQQIHDEILRQGLLGNNVLLGTALVDMYAKCGALAKAQLLLEELCVRDVVSWNALIGEYAQQGQGQQALNCFEQMQHEGLSPDAVTFLCIVQACGTIAATDKGEQIHGQIVKQGLLGNDIVLGNALVDMYAKCSALGKARRMFAELPVQDVFSWNALIAGYAQQGEGEQALKCFERMQCEGISPYAMTFSCILKACGSIGATDKGEQVHDEIARQGLLENNIMLGNALLDMYIRCRVLMKATRLLEELPVRDVISWNALIAGCAQQGQCKHAVNCFEQMQCQGLSPDAVTFLCILKACGSIGAADKGEQIHDEIVRQGLLRNDIVLGNALVDMYAKCGALTEAREALDELPARDIVSWNALIAGYAQQDQGEEALNCFERMQREGLSPYVVTFLCILKACGSIGAVKKGEQIHDEMARQGLLGTNFVLGNALVDMYAKFGALERARQVLEELPIKDVASWNALIVGYDQEDKGKQALDCFEQMQHEGLCPDEVTFLCISKACGSMGVIDKGEQIHDEVARQGLLGEDIVLGIALVDMYAKCGALAKARQVLEELRVRDVVLWNALITGYAQQGQSHQALDCFRKMQCEGLSPNAVTFLCVLNACSHLGLVDGGQMYFVNMSTNYGLEPDLEHYGCMIDLFGRAGHIDKAVSVIQRMPCLAYYSEYVRAVWSSLLGACQKWGDINVGKWAFEHAVQVDKRDGEPYVLMADMYTAAGMQEDAKRIEVMRLANEA